MKQLNIPANEKQIIYEFKNHLKNALGQNLISVQLFGSKARGDWQKESDLDILFLFTKKIDIEQLKKEIERSFITFNQEVSPRVESLNNFKKNINKGIYETIIKNHIIIKGALDYIEIIESFD